MIMTKNAKLDFARVIDHEDHQIIVYRKKDRLVAVSRLHVRDKIYVTMQAERVMENQDLLTLMFLQHQGPFRVKIKGLEQMIPDLEEVALEMFAGMQKRVEKINAE